VSLFHLCLVVTEYNQNYIASLRKCHSCARLMKYSFSKPQRARRRIRQRVILLCFGRVKKMWLRGRRSFTAAGFFTLSIHTNIINRLLQAKSHHRIIMIWNCALISSRRCRFLWLISIRLVFEKANIIMYHFKIYGVNFTGKHNMCKTS
jgi:hypothetical protein